MTSMGQRLGQSEDEGAARLPYFKPELIDITADDAAANKFAGAGEVTSTGGRTFGVS